jgi:hypothetical protein
MKKINIKQKLENIGISLDSIIMGDFDYIGRFTAERHRNQDDPNYKKYGAFYRSNYERGILIYHLIRKYEITSMLEIGFGRGYSTFCAAKAFHDAGVKGNITTVDPALDEKYLNMLQQVFPKDWFDYIQFVKGTSSQMLPQISGKFDFVYIDGDHSYEGTKSDWEMTKEKWNKCLLFDDYHLPTKNDPGIQCRDLIDSIQDDSKELIIMDRRMFFDDRRFTDEQIDYGQVLLTKPELQSNDWLSQ